MTNHKMSYEGWGERLVDPELSREHERALDRLRPGGQGTRFWPKQGLAAAPLAHHISTTTRHIGRLEMADHDEPGLSLTKNVADALGLDVVEGAKLDETRAREVRGTV